MGIDLTTGLMIAQVGIGVVQGVAGAVTAANQASSEKDKAAAQTRATYAEIGRQEVQVNDIAAEQTSDRVRAANATLASARVAAGERGLSGSSMQQLVSQMAYLEGADVFRIERNRQGNIAAGEAAKASAKLGYQETVSIANNQQAVATTGALLGAVGSGLSISSNYYQNQQRLTAMQNVVH